MFYEQVEGAAVRSTVSTIVANLHMEKFEGEALRSASHPSRLWYRFVDDMWIIQQQAHKELFLDYINSIDPYISSWSKQIRRMGPSLFLIPWSNHRQTIPVMFTVPYMMTNALTRFLCIYLLIVLT